jgi:hypothetical protein
MTWTSDDELNDFVVRFCERTLPKTEWTHAAHLAVGTWHVHHHGLAIAVELLRERIHALNESHGTPNTVSSGYHETITRAYAHLIADFLSSCDEGTTLADRVQALLASPLSGKSALLAFYSPDRLMSVAARRGWVAPDLKPLPAR